MADRQVKVLFVDDDTVILQALTHLVKGEEYQLLTASSGEEALDLLRGGTRWR